MPKHFKNFLYMASMQAGNYLLPFITIPYVARIFGPVNLGLINYMSAIIGYFALVVTFSFNFTGVRRLSQGKEDEDRIFFRIFFSQMYLFVLCTVAFGVLTVAIAELKNNYLLMIVSYISCMTSLFNQNWFLQARGSFKVVAIISFLTKLGSFILIFSFVKAPSDVILYVLLLNICALVGGIVSFIYVVRKFRLKYTFFSPVACLDMLREGQILFLSSVSTSLYASSGVVLLGAINGKVDVGYYSAAYKLTEVLRVAAFAPFFQVLFPLISRKMKHDREVVLDSIRKFMPIACAGSLSTLIFSILFGKMLISLLYGAKFMPAYPIFVVLSFGLVAVFFGMLIGGQVMLNLGLDKPFLQIQIFVSVFSLAANYLILPWGAGMTTAAIWTLSEIAISILQAAILARLGVKVFDKDAFRLASLKECAHTITSSLRKNG